MIKDTRKTKVAVAISGGVDSSVAAFLLEKQGYDVVGVHMICYSEDVPYCTSQEDREFAVRVASHLDIPLKIYDFREEYRQKVIDYMVEEYRANRTPNPDVMCNKEIKFGILFEHVFDDLGVDYVATGHYARVVKGDSGTISLRDAVGKPGFLSLQIPAAAYLSGIDKRLSGLVGSLINSLQGTLQETFPTSPSFKEEDTSRRNLRELSQIGSLQHNESNEGKFSLKIPEDSSKDQTYFLYPLTSDQLSKTLFPLGDIKKEEVKEIARESGLPTAEKKESMGICFVGDVSIHNFLKDYIPYNEGEVVDEDGRVIGNHKGLPYYTVGQRSGFDLTKYSAKPLYVLGKRVEKNQLVVGSRESLRVREFLVEPSSPRLRRAKEVRGRAERGGLYVRIRHLGKLHSCEIREGEDPAERDEGNIKVVCEEPVEAVAPGQAAVFYNDEGVVVGGGVIGD